MPFDGTSSYGKDYPAHAVQRREGYAPVQASKDSAPFDATSSYKVPPLQTGCGGRRVAARTEGSGRNLLCCLPLQGIDAPWPSSDETQQTRPALLPRACRAYLMCPWVLHWVNLCIRGSKWLLQHGLDLHCSRMSAGCCMPRLSVGGVQENYPAHAVQPRMGHNGVAYVANNVPFEGTSAYSVTPLASQHGPSSTASELCRPCICPQDEGMPQLAVMLSHAGVCRHAESLQRCSVRSGT